jgi:hypothetical protein
MCQDKTPPEPSDSQNAPPSGTFEPTSAPTTSSAPSAAVDKTPPEVPVNQCPEDVVLLSTVGDTQWPQVPIVILEQTGTFVKFSVQNTAVDVVSHIWTQFHEKSNGAKDCFETDNIERGESIEYTAYCMLKVPISIVDIWVSDDSLNATSDNAEVPPCCHPPAADTNPKVQWTFKLRCVSECVPTTAPGNDGRRLGGSHLHLDDGKSATKANFATAIKQDHKGVVVDKASGPSKSSHFCDSVDYPCEDGDKSDMVYVCHYSAKHGYQTFCVTEPDSDILGFYPKDYCGPCVGGYGEHSVQRK